MVMPGLAAVARGTRRVDAAALAGISLRTLDRSIADEVPFELLPSSGQ